MTDIETRARERIRELQEAGLTMKAQAKMLGVSRSAYERFARNAIATRSLAVVPAEVLAIPDPPPQPPKPRRCTPNQKPPINPDPEIHRDARAHLSMLLASGESFRSVAACLNIAPWHLRRWHDSTTAVTAVIDPAEVLRLQPTLPDWELARFRVNRFAWVNDITGARLAEILGCDAGELKAFRWNRLGHMTTASAQQISELSEPLLEAPPRNPALTAHERHTEIVEEFQFLREGMCLTRAFDRLVAGHTIARHELRQILIAAGQCGPDDLKAVE